MILDSRTFIVEVEEMPSDEIMEKLFWPINDAITVALDLACDAVTHDLKEAGLTVTIRVQD
ncbi:hypothetical protein LCGC14_0378840 [marine sediment metagenome]|uniref:Uncharacterized protein n=1 Tax=marine sediment metagenome TaxID=412755 RepID=A0A0F9VQA1_9ZZZZ